MNLNDVFLSWFCIIYELERFSYWLRIVFDALCANPKVTVQRLDGLLSVIPRGENILQIHNTIIWPVQGIYSN